MKITKEQYDTLERTFKEVEKLIGSYRFGQHAFNWTQEHDYELFINLMQPLDESQNLFYINSDAARKLIQSYMEQ